MTIDTKCEPEIYGRRRRLVGWCCGGALAKLQSVQIGLEVGAGIGWVTQAGCCSINPLRVGDVHRCYDGYDPCMLQHNILTKAQSRKPAA